MGVQTLIQIRRGTTSQWNSSNPTLAAGEWGLDTSNGRYKLGDGLTAWNSLKFAGIQPNSNDLVGESGIGITFSSSGVPVSVSVTGITSSQMTDFNTAVDARVTAGSVSAEEIMDILGTGLVSGTGVGIDYQDANNLIAVNVTGISHSLVNDFDDAVTAIVATGSLSEENVMDIIGTGLVNGTNTTVTYSDVGNTVAVNVNGLDHDDISDFDTAVTDIMATGNASTATEATNVTTTANNSTDETVYITFVDGATGTQGIETDTNLTYNPSTNTLSAGIISTTGNVTVGGNLSVAGTTTTVNSTTVEIGDNIIRVNTSGLTEGGMEIQDGNTGTYKKFVWDNNDSRFEAQGSIQASGFIGNLTGNADTVTNGVYTSDTGSVTSAMILDNTIVDGDINTSANINVQKLASGSTGQVLQVSSTGIIWGGIDGGTP